MKAGARTARQSKPHLSNPQYKREKVTIEQFFTGQRGLLLGLLLQLVEENISFLGGSGTVS